MKYFVIIEKLEGDGYSAYVPDLPLCFTVGDTMEEVKSNIKEAIELYLEDAEEQGIHINIPNEKFTALVEV